MKSILKYGVVGTLLFSSQVHASEPVNIGVIDSPISELVIDNKNVSIVNKNFVSDDVSKNIWKNKVNRMHGEIVASSFVEQFRKFTPNAPVKIFSATAFFEKSKREADGKRSLALDSKGILKALDWFHENNVRIVVTSFVMKDGPNAKKFAEKAKELNIVLFSATNNSADQPTFPAQYSSVISVCEDSIDTSSKHKNNLSKWVSFLANGENPGNRKNIGMESGASFAAPRAAAFGAFFLQSFPDASHDDVLKAMQYSATRKTFSNSVLLLVGDDLSVIKFKDTLSNMTSSKTDVRLGKSVINMPQNGISL